MRSKLTKNQKLEIYQKCLKLYKSKKTINGFLCLDIYDLTRNYSLLSFNILENFPEIAKQKPKNITYLYTQWFDVNEYGRKKRIEILEKAIKMLN